MRFKKFLLIPLLLFIYIFFIVDLLVSFNPTTLTGAAPPTGGGQPVGVGTAVSITVRRPYFFKLIKLPVYTNYIGYIGNYHKAFFYFVGILTAVFVVLEFFVEIDWGIGVGRGVGKGIVKSIGRDASKNLEITEKTEWRGEKMKRKSWMKDLAKALGFGVVFGFVIFLLSADAGVSVGLGLLLMYLEYKLK